MYQKKTGKSLEPTDLDSQTGELLLVVRHGVGEVHQVVEVYGVVLSQSKRQLKTLRVI